MSKDVIKECPNCHRGPGYQLYRKAFAEYQREQEEKGLPIFKTETEELLADVTGYMSLGFTSVYQCDWCGKVFCGCCGRDERYGVMCPDCYPVTSKTSKKSNRKPLSSTELGELTYCRHKSPYSSRYRCIR